MAIRVTLTNKSQQTKRLSSVEDTTENLTMSRTVYQQFRSLAQNKTIVDRHNAGEIPLEFKEILDEFQKLMDGEEVSDDIKILDEYLGSLGYEYTYPYEKDKIDILPWVDVTTPSEYRNVITSELDVNGDVENVVASISGEVYNIIHKT